MNSIILYFINILNILLNRCLLSITTLPDLISIIITLGLLILLSVIIIPIGYLLKFFNFKILKDFKKAVFFIILLFFAPSFFEELFFRVILLPHVTEKYSLGSFLICGIISLLLFIVYHPVNAKLLYKPGRLTFFNPVFLFIAGLIGLFCTISYWLSGSIWTCVLIHWIIVTVWILFFGGYDELFKKKKLNI